MQILDGTLLLAPGDLTNNLACPRLTELNRAVARGELTKVHRGPDPHLELIREHGEAHEQRYLDGLRDEFGEDAVVTIPDPDRSQGIDGLRDAAAATAEAMRSGTPVIHQAAFLDGHWRGYADFLMRVDRPSVLGDYSYEVVDTKLARGFKPYFAHQLCRYSLHVEAMQGRRPEHAHIVLGTGEQVSFRVDDVLALHRHAAARLESALADDVSTFEPDPVAHCALCDYQRDCTRILRERDDLSFVATLGRDQRAKLTDVGIATLAALAATAPDATAADLSETTFTRIHVQAELQLETRDTGELQHRHLPAEWARGYARIPKPSPTDVFFDLEGDPFIGEKGIEYLWGWELLDGDGEPQYFVEWAHDEQQERETFERFVDFIVQRRAANPGMHVFHYAHHEISTLRRLAAQYGTREAEIDAFLRDDVFVDLYAVVRQGIQVGQEGYSIKNLEPFYMEERESEIKQAGGSIVAYELWLKVQEQSVLDEIALYNAEDCRSTRLLRDWLLEMRDEAADEQDVDFAALQEPEPEDPVVDPDWVVPLQELQDRLEAGLSEDAGDDDAAAASRRLLASLLFYHRREQKPQWWRFFDLQDMTAIELEHEADAIAGLVPDPDEAPFADKRSTCTWLTFPVQEHRMSPGSVIDPATGMGAGEILEVDGQRLLLKQGPKPAAAGLPEALVGSSPLDTRSQRAALIRVAEDVLAGGGGYPAINALLRRDTPRVAGVAAGAPLVTGPVDEDSGVVVTLSLDDTCLPVQGPPGAGKTYTGARMIVAALNAGKRVAVCATSHKAVHNLVAEVEKVAHERGVALRGMHKHSGDDSEYVGEHDLVDSTDKNPEAADPELNLVSGTPWLLSRPEHDQAFDLLFVDEAGQMALADAVAVGGCARSMVLLGDPQQLPQVSQGTHPEGADASVLEHILGDAATIPPDRGLFLEETWRMQPEICTYISDRFYDGRLHAVDGCAGQQIDLGGRHFAGLELVEVEHDGRSQASPEEAASIAARCAELLAGGKATTREHGIRSLRPEDILVVAPYNLAVRMIQSAVPAGVRVGTVDRFQGQEAPVVFYAMTSSTGADAPRGLDFLFQPTRMNVAISRAQCLAILVCSPRLLDAECQTLEQMRMVNHVCAYAEAASGVAVS